MKHRLKRQADIPARKTGDYRSGTPPQRGFWAWKPLLVYALFTVVIILFGYAAFESYKESMKQNALSDLGGIAELKNKQITSWITGRKGDAQTLKDDALFLAEAESWLRQGGPDGRSRNALTARLASLQQARAAYGYDSISLFDSQGELRLTSSAEVAPIVGVEKERLFESMRSGQIILSDLHRESVGAADRVELELWAPLVVARNGSRHTIGAVLFRINPSVFLFPLIQTWPTPSPSAETLLVRRDGDDVIFLNQLRHAGNSPLDMRRPLHDTQLLAAKAVMGQEGLVAGRDYRGVPVVGVLTRVTGSSWIMISKIDQSELNAPINRLADWIAVLMLVVIGAGGGITLTLLRKERKYYERELERRALEQHLDYLSRYSNDIILLLNTKGNIVEFNDRALEAYGYSAEEFSGMYMDDLLAEGRTLPFAERFKSIEKAGGALVFESVHVRRNGDTFPVEASVRRIDAGAEDFYQSIIRDITERKRDEDILRFHSEILNNLSEGVFLVRLDNGTIVFTNPQFERMFGYGPGELLGKHVSLLNAPDGKAPELVAQEINEELEQKGVWVGDVLNVRKDGSTLWCQVSVSVFEHPQFGKIGVAVHEDITERKNLERRIHERRRGMDEVQKLHVAAQTASAIAHELNQPLLAIASYSKAALLMLKADRPDYAEIRNAIEGSERQAHRAGQAIREMFDFLNSTEFPTDDFDLVQEIIAILEDARKEHELHFQSVLRLEEKIPLVHANRTHVQKTLSNLLRNGIEAAMTQSGSQTPFITVTVHKASDEKFGQVTVQDNGPGFTRENAQHLFEPFFTTKEGGFGMGLSISRSLIEMNGGQLWVEQKEGPGAVFHLTLPFAAERA